MWKRGITALVALAAFDGLVALGSGWKWLGISGLGMGKEWEGEKKRVFAEKNAKGRENIHLRK